ncbi:MAG: aminotransferase class I/II-fold pyridoxal phosphate-dependent enzyme [Gemmataceae bacterium]
MDDNPLGVSRPLSPPLFPASVYALPDLDALDRIMDGHAPGYFYARDGHPNGDALGDALARLENADWGLITPSGMAAVAAAIVPQLQSGDRVVASDRLYGRTAQLLQQELARFGVTTTWVDVSDLDGVRRALVEPSRLLYVETISNPLLRVADLDRLADLAYSHKARFVVDNTFATPSLCKPLDRGADLVIESLTKFVGGHSDVTLGAVCGESEDEDLSQAVGQVASIWGLAAPPFDCWLALRSLATLEVRMRAACESAATLAEWLARRSGVVRVVYPGRRDHPDHSLARKQLPLGAGPMLCFELDGGRDAVNRFLRRAVGVPFSPSLGHSGTTLSYPAGTSHRFVDPADRQRQGITDGLLRLSVGVEPVEEIKKELARGLG